MNSKICALSLSLLAGACALAMPTVSHAGNVGYIVGQTCSGPGDKTAAITAAGHTPVAITSISQASLAGLSALVFESCGTYSNNVDVNNAVNSGMGLVVSDWNPDTSTTTRLPGPFASSYISDCITTTNFPPGSPAANGPGGALSNTSLDGGNCSAHGHTSAAALPGGVQVLTTTDDSTDQAISLMHSHGAGKVAYAPLPWSWFLPGGSGSGNVAAPGIQSFMVNLIGLAAGQGSTTTCAGEGYKGAQLTWCQNICENGLSGQVLDTWIHRWIKRYRDLPYCAVVQEQPET